MLNNPKSTEEYLCNNVEIELNSKLPRDRCSHASENNLICGVCDALPPAGSKLMYGAMHQIAMGNRSAIGAFYILYQLNWKLKFCTNFAQ